MKYLLIAGMLSLGLLFAGCADNADDTAAATDPANVIPASTSEAPAPAAEPTEAATAEPPADADADTEEAADST